VLEPNSLANHDLAVSLDGRFVAVASFTAEVGIVTEYVYNGLQADRLQQGVICLGDAVPGLSVWYRVAAARFELLPGFSSHGNLAGIVTSSHVCSVPQVKIWEIKRAKETGEVTGEYTTDASTQQSCPPSVHGLAMPGWYHHCHFAHHEPFGHSGAVKAMELKGHKSQVLAVSFSPDSRRAVTVSKDGTLRVWNIDVRYHLAEDPKTLLVVSGQYSA
jgi:WD40 repeat protein